MNLKLPVKRIYCPHCKRLVRGQEKEKGKEEKNNGTIQILCSICNRLIWVWNGLNWQAKR